MNKEERTVYITTPIYYPNSKPHVGTLYTTLLGDFLTRFYKLLGKDVFFLVGLDEHGQKLETEAKKHNMKPKEFVDSMQKYFREPWEKFQIEYSRFIRTTDPQHEETVKYVLEKLYEKGYIYEGKYNGYYCYKCESFYPVSKLIKEGDKYLCPIHLSEVEYLSEDTYLLKLTEFKDWIKNLIENGNILYPEFYKKEVLNYIKELKDLSIARPKSRVTWGVPLPFNKDYVVYVWIDALLNYLSGIGYPDEIYKKYWPAIHVIGKDIVKFHAVIWPIILKMIDVSPPKKIIVHCFWTRKGLKISKSLKNKVFAEDLYDKVDAVRYYLLRNSPIEHDSEFIFEDLERTYNTELADIIGNGFRRVTKLSLKLNGIVQGKLEDEVSENLEKFIREAKEKMEQFKISQYVLKVLGIFKYLNEYLQEKEPWKDLNVEVIYNALFISKVGFHLLYPILPYTSIKALKSIGVNLRSIDFVMLQETFYVKESPILFPKTTS